MVNRHSELVDEIYLITRYKFRNESLLSEVFSPPQVCPSNVTTLYCYDRLEFLGDSVLNLVVSLILFKLYPMENEGDLTLRKHHLVNGRKLSEISRSLNIMKFMPLYPSKSGPKESDTLEALIGAIFIDGGFDSAKEFIVSNWKKLAHELRVAPLDEKSELFIWVQKRHLPNPFYKIINKTQLEDNYTLTLQLKNTHSLGTVKIQTHGKKRGEINAAKAMLERIKNRKKWKTLFKTVGDYVTEQDLILTSEDIKRRLHLWCKAHNSSLPRYKTTQEKNAHNQILFTSLVYLDCGRGAYGVSSALSVAEKTAALKLLLRFCDEERENAMFGNKIHPCEIDVCIPKDFKSLLNEWVVKNHLGEVKYASHKLIPDKMFVVFLTIPQTNLGTVCSKFYSKKLAEQNAASLMIERIVTQLTTLRNQTDNFQLQNCSNYKLKLTHS